MGLEYIERTPRQVGESPTLLAAGSAARTAAELGGVHRNTAARFFPRVRSVIAVRQEREVAEALRDPVGIDESYFGGRRRGGRGRGAGKVVAFGIPGRGAVYARMTADCRRAAPVPIIRRKAAPAGVVYPDSGAGYGALSAGGYRHERIDRDEEWLCEAPEVSASGYYAWAARPDTVKGRCDGSALFTVLNAFRRHCGRHVPAVRVGRAADAVLNAFRRHCGRHTEHGPESRHDRADMCSTPFGVTAVGTGRSSGTGRGISEVLNAFRRHCGRHPPGRCRRASPDDVLNAFRRHCGRHNIGQTRSAST